MTHVPPRAVWSGTPPANCDLSTIRGVAPHPITDEFVDGKTTFGPWANMCPACHRLYGVGLGLGRGQQYRREGNEFVKV